MIFSSNESLNSAVAFRQDIRRRAAGFGRNPDQIRILCAAMVVVAETDAEAMAKHEAFAELVHPLAGRSRLAYHVNVDLTKYDLDGPLPSLQEVGG